MKRERIQDRDYFSYEEKCEISNKSHDRCCHCGKLAYWNYGATVDHFIPLHKGGTNRKINLIMLCEDCNKEKDDKIMDIAYCRYLDDKYKEELAGYLNSYIISFDYINRNNMFACDEYSILMLDDTYYQARMKHKKNKKLENLRLGMKYLIKKATWSDFSRLCEYFKKYCVRYDCFASDEAVEINISFWLQFGAVYYFERNGEISVMTVFTIKHMPKMSSYKNLDYVLNMYIFSYYASNNALSLVTNMVTELPNFILKEQNLDFIPLNVLLLDVDKLYPSLRAYVGNATSGNAVNGFKEIGCVVFSKNLNNCEVTEPALKKVAKFFDKFSMVRNEVISYFKSSPDIYWADWMLYDIFSPQDIADMNILQKGSKVEEFNNHCLNVIANWEIRESLK
jgi:hypothetical protein